MAKVAFLGLGVMGYPMAGHLKTKGGHEVTVYNRTAAKAEKWVAQFGGRSAKTAEISLHVAAENYGVVEDAHQALMHILAQYVRMSEVPAELAQTLRF